MSVAPIDPVEFVSLVKPALEAQDMKGLLLLLKSHWSYEQIIGLLACPHADARKVAALSLALVGKKCCLEKVAAQLKDADPMTNQMAEHALWSIWFRCGNAAANAHVARGAVALERREIEQAVEHFSEAIDLDASFAEAYNQRAIAHYLAEQYEESLADCKQAVERMPCHFGAWAGLGHCYTHLGRIPEAVRAYERALAINPHLDCVAEAIRQLRPACCESSTPECEQ